MCRRIERDPIIITRHDLRSELYSMELPSAMEDLLTQSLEVAGNTDSTVGDPKLRSRFEHERCCDQGRKKTYRSSSSTPPDYKIISQNPGPLFGEPIADVATGDSCLTSRITATSMPATSRTNSPSPQSRTWDALSTQTSGTSKSAADESTNETSMQDLTWTSAPDASETDLGAPMTQTPRPGLS
ncbi:hypothetical protein QQS21_011101 [Conoideocrella luteorostrata]|uniref:Uncharacterized protein n=1 Tax=Conoideocrella luteorostrata TaxID=1105319 RepID=A0AAJ0CI95_9HYPO|nr:hypothetical protein QQS21_011101 [Conoideocrella luteorostrata]